MIQQIDLKKLVRSKQLAKFYLSSAPLQEGLINITHRSAVFMIESPQMYILIIIIE